MYPTLAVSAAPLDWIAPLPKAELHCHAWAVVDPEILAELHRRGFEMPIGPQELAALTPARTRDAFGAWHLALKPLRRNFDALKVLIAIHAQRLSAQNVQYAEVMLGTGVLDLGDPPLPDDASVMIEKLGQLKALANAATEGTTQVELLLGFSTKGSQAVTRDWIQPVIQMHESGVIVGMAWAGLDEGYPLAPHAYTLAAFHEAGIPMEIHAGEWDGPQRIREGIEQGFAARVGHGIAAFHDPYLIDLLRERQIHLELCPTSNACTGVVPSIDEHPLRQALDLGLNFSINSDDPGTFSCSVESEYRLAAEKFGFSEDDLLRVTGNALASRFAQRPGLEIRPGASRGGADAISRRS